MLRMGENISKQRINLQTIQAVSSCSSIAKITNILVKKKKKMGGRPKQIFLQRRHTDSQQTHEKMLNIAYYEKWKSKLQ